MRFILSHSRVFSRFEPCAFLTSRFGATQHERASASAVSEARLRGPNNSGPGVTSISFASAPAVIDLYSLCIQHHKCNAPPTHTPCTAPVHLYLWWHAVRSHKNG